MAPVDSIQLHGKLWLNEDDTRTYLSGKSAGFGRVDTLQGTLWVHQRNFAHNLAAQRCGIWWMDHRAGWLADKDCGYQNLNKQAMPHLGKLQK